MKYIISIIAMMSVSFSYAQNINWSSIDENQNDIVYLNFGYDFGLTTQLGYGYKINTKNPILLTSDFSFPKGKDLFDDFKFRLGGEISIYEKEHFILSAKAKGIFRRHQTKLVSMSNFGSEVTAIFGYYKPTWHIATEFGFDKSITTNLKHSSLMQDNYPSIKDGWFIPSGGNFYYGIQASKTIGNSFELSLRAGATNAQFKDQNAILPYYAQLGLSYRISS